MDLMPSSSSSFSKSKSQQMYDVFINFRGEDTRRNFVSHLYTALKKAGVNPFLDNENLHKGEKLKQLMSAIEESQIAIVVFSNSYTESSWCLDELEKIIECNENCGQSVLVVFYNIDPSVVRHHDQESNFGKALRAAVEKKYRTSGQRRDNTMLLRWSGALTKASNFSGWNASQYGNDAELVEDIVNEVLNKLVYNVLDITKYPVGLESRTQRVIDFLKNRFNKVSIIGIWGMGGSGKTTLAKAIYNEINNRFKHKSFIENIREVCCQTDRRGLASLQEKLLSDILKTKYKIQSTGTGITAINTRLFRKKVFIALDDVNDFGQLEALCGNREWFGDGTVVIITTRDVGILTRLNVDYVYEMEEMNKNESLELFSFHAFGEANPRKDFNELARSAVTYCGGLPLALKTIGSNLFNRKTKEVWKSALSKLEVTPDHQVQQKLRISYEDLKDNFERDTFLDVCCFFIGEDRAYVTDILNGCGLQADSVIPVLIEHGLIRVEKDNKFGMHPLLQEMGREIVCEDLKKEPEKRSRLWFDKDVIDVLKNKNGTEAIEGLALKSLSTNKDCFKTDAFDKMKKLRLLQLDHVKLSGSYGYLPKKLRWISWQGFPSKDMPDNFYLEDVIVVDLKHSHLRFLWKEPQVWLKFLNPRLVWKKTQVLKGLKILNLSHSKFLTETPDFSRLPSLEKLILEDCPSLCQVHKSIGDLNNLLLINLKDCSRLRNLPSDIYKLKSLKTLILSDCSKIHKFEEDIVQMKSLTTLITENTVVKHMPFSVLSSKAIGYIFMGRFEKLSHNVFPSIILSWMSPTMNPLSYIHPFCGTSSSLVSMIKHNDDLGNLEPMPSILSNLRSVLVQCDTLSQLSRQLRTILEDANFPALEMTSYTSPISKNSLQYFLICMGNYDEVFNTLSDSISEGLATSESCDVFLPGDNDPYWLAFMGEEHAVHFTVPGDCQIKGMALCVVYLSNPQIMATECLTGVLIVNYTKCIVQIHKRDTVISFNDKDWQGIISLLGAGDKVEIFMIFGHELVVKKTAVYLIYGESIDMEMELPPEPNENALIRFVKKVVLCDFWDWNQRI